MTRLAMSVVSALSLAFLLLATPGMAEAAPAKRIVVSIADQRLYAYEGGKLVLSTPITTGRPEAPTPRGTFTVQAKISPKRFVSLWPRGHPFYYDPLNSAYALQFIPNYYIHDASWRASFGPGTNVSHVDAWGRRRTGSLGCVNVPSGAMARLYGWATPGTVVSVI